MTAVRKHFNMRKCRHGRGADQKNLKRREIHQQRALATISKRFSSFLQAALGFELKKAIPMFKRRNIILWKCRRKVSASEPARFDSKKNDNTYLKC